jgi:hypothetical protein
VWKGKLNLEWEPDWEVKWKLRVMGTLTLKLELELKKDEEYLDLKKDKGKTVCCQDSDSQRFTWTFAGPNVFKRLPWTR